MARAGQRLTGKAQAGQLAALSMQVFGEGGIEIRRFVKTLSTPPLFRLETSQGVIKLGGARELLSRPRCQANIYAATGFIIPAFDREYWISVVGSLTEARDEEEAVDSQQREEKWQVREYLALYLESVKQDKQEAFATDAPYEEQGHIYFFGRAFAQYMAPYVGFFYAPPKYGYILREAGWTPTHTAIMKGEKKIHKRVWAMPQRAAIVPGRVDNDTTDGGTTVAVTED